MKKILSFAFISFLIVFNCVDAHAQYSSSFRFGLKGGVTSQTSSFKEVNKKTINNYHLGGLVYIPLGFGFGLQPELLYAVKGASLEQIQTGGASASNFDLKMGFVEIPVQVQWGMDLFFVRPYAFTEAFFGFGVNSFNTGDGQKVNLFDKFKKARWEYGFAAGVGLEFWKFQFAAKFYWNLGELSNSAGSNAWGNFANIFKGKKKCDGMMFSLGFLF